MRAVTLIELMKTKQEEEYKNKLEKGVVNIEGFHISVGFITPNCQKHGKQGQKIAEPSEGPAFENTPFCCSPAHEKKQEEDENDDHLEKD